MKRPRIIPTLLIDEGNLVKTKRFGSSVYLGDPINAIKIFNEKFVDELCVLDIGASKRKKSPNFDLLCDMTSEAFMPLSYGGGITSIDEIRHLFRIGFEKVIINSAFIRNNELIREVASMFGNQSVICAIDYRNTWLGYRCYIEDGTKKTRIHPIDLARTAEKMGAGEVLLYCMDNDGMQKGYNIDLIRSLAPEISIPLIACGGANTLVDLKCALDAGASAVAAGSMFVFYGKRKAVLINYPEEKELINAGIYS